MATEAPLKVVLCWHMHQPDYRDHKRNEFQLPWVYLHGIRDYIDMAAHLEAVPEAKAVVNFSPILLVQLEEYERQINDYLHNAGTIRDPLLSMLDSPVFPSDYGQRLSIIKSCIRANKKHQIDRFSPYQKLVVIAEMVMNDPDSNAYINDQYLADLVTWYHLAWLGETVRRADTRIIKLIEQAYGYTLHQRRVLLEVIAELISSLRGRYVRLAESGRIELSMSPHTHPMLPLLIDLNSARESQPEIHLPMQKTYPGGMERADWHMQRGLEVFQKYFNRTPVGCWPSEGGISGATLDVIAKYGFRWVATGESVLRNSIRQSASGDNGASIYSAYYHPRSNLRLFARDDTLSDRIGFTYTDWHSDDAVGDLLHRLGMIANDHADKENTVVSIIMDGENAWEYYSENGYYFLSNLYQRLTKDPRIQLCTYADLLETRALPLEQIVSGSWVYGTFSTWIGNEDKNRAWDVLCELKLVYDECCQQLDPQIRAKVDAQLGACEGSDWFWWFGDYNPARMVSDFEHLFRTHVAGLYQMLNREPPQYLTQVLAHGTGSPEHGGVMRHGRADN